MALTAENEGQDQHLPGAQGRTGPDPGSHAAQVTDGGLILYGLGRQHQGSPDRHVAAIAAPALVFGHGPRRRPAIEPQRCSNAILQFDKRLQKINAICRIEGAEGVFRKRAI